MAHADPFADEMRRCVDVLDRLIADRSAGKPSQPRHDGHVDQVEEVAARLRKAARGPGPTPNPPRWISSDGTRAGW